MTLTPTDWAGIATFALAAIVASSFNGKRRERRKYRGKRVGKPDEHSAGIRVSRRDINTGSWT